jgi:hypothetical protein
MQLSFQDSLVQYCDHRKLDLLKAQDQVQQGQLQVVNRVQGLYLITPNDTLQPFFDPLLNFGLPGQRPRKRQLANLLGGAAHKLELRYGFSQHRRPSNPTESYGLWLEITRMMERFDLWKLYARDRISSNPPPPEQLQPLK